MFIIFLLLLSLNALAEFQFNKMMLRLGVLEKKYRFYHTVCAVLRVAGISLCAWVNIPMPVMLIGLFILLFANVVPYRDRAALLNNFTLIIYLIYVTLLMTVIGVAGILGINVAYMLEDTLIRVIVLNTTFMIFDLVCFWILRYHPESIWKEDYDSFKVMTYTRFLAVCSVYHILDAVILAVYNSGRTNYVLLLSGDMLIMFLMLNFWKYNSVFAKSEEMKREYEENQILIAQQYFEKETLKKISEFDALTNTYNRREISSIMLESIQKGHKLGCVFIDLDGLKRTNDRYGHTFGDLMLKRFADACAEILADNGYLARIGGDEFLLIFLDREIESIEKDIKELQIKLLEAGSEKEKIYFSYGISYDEDSVDEYIVLADQRMYADKNRKRCDNV